MGIDQWECEYWLCSRTPLGPTSSLLNIVCDEQGPVRCMAGTHAGTVVGCLTHPSPCELDLQYGVWQEPMLGLSWVLTHPSTRVGLAVWCMAGTRGWWSARTGGCVWLLDCVMNGSVDAGLLSLPQMQMSSRQLYHLPVSTLPVYVEVCVCEYVYFCVFYPTWLITRTLGPSNDFTLLNGCTGKCVRLSRLQVGFRMHFKSLHFYSFIHTARQSF